ncbi:hypothetical protein B9479_006501 [Cryptococcus floricola]|uniref:Major facilitator superfamily (MFS) profile domain-containing protein n=1 Tax=Cryptococcus floricola TaxID=2591691 RepID=A0A5D3ASZ3_9TREE|nr:hypothetical protein B9479_006501 [Cryptococcus floricola]
MTGGSSHVDWRSIPNAIDHTPWPKNRGLSKLFFFSSVLYMGQFLNGYDGTITGGLQALPDWNKDLGYPSAGRIGLLNAASYIVGVCMGPLNAWVVDKFGRKWPIRWYAFAMIVGTVIGCVAGSQSGNTGYGLFVASRAIIGSGVPVFLMAAQIVNQEMAHPRFRPQMAAYWDCNWVLGSTVASFITFGTSYINSSWSWRIPYLIQLLPALYMLVAVQFMPETPRFLIANGKEEEAYRFFVDYHGNGDEEDELVKFEWREMKETIEMEKGEKLGWTQLLKTRANVHRLGLVALITTMPQLNGSTMISYYYSIILTQCGITGAGQITGIGAGLNMYSFILQCLGVYSLRYFGRRSMVLSTWPLLMLGMAAMAATSGVYQHSGQSDKGAGIANVVMVWLYSTPWNYVSPIFYSYPAEILNYEIRGKGMAVWNTVNQGWGAYGSYVNSIALDTIGYKYYCVYIPILALQWVLTYFFMVEVKGLTLEEIAIAFEGDNAAVARVDARLAEGVSGGTGEGDDDEKKLGLSGTSVIAPVI